MFARSDYDYSLLFSLLPENFSRNFLPSSDCDKTASMFATAVPPTADIRSITLYRPFDGVSAAHSTFKPPALAQFAGEDGVTLRLPYCHACLSGLRDFGRPARAASPPEPPPPRAVPLLAARADSNPARVLAAGDEQSLIVPDWSDQPRLLWRRSRLQGQLSLMRICE
jgi:hypothetical protein